MIVQNCFFMHLLEVEVWRVEGNKLAEVKKEDYGNFFAGDCYVILYTYKPKLRDEYILYSWQGQNSTKDEVYKMFFQEKLYSLHAVVILQK